MTSYANWKQQIEQSLNNLLNEFNNPEENQFNYLLNELDADLKAGVDEKTIDLKYDSCCNKFNEFTISNQKKIYEIEQIIKDNSWLIDVDYFRKILGDKTYRANKTIEGISDRFFGILERKGELVATNKMNNLDSIEHKIFNDNQIPQSIQTNDNEIDIINNSMNVLKQWSNKNTFNVIFDSNIDGDGSRNVLYDKVMKKSNLYFISSDDNGNIFGGYVSKEMSDDLICDKDSFVFSLTRNGEESKAFRLFQINEEGLLYKFGGNIMFSDIKIFCVGKSNSYCYRGQYCGYNYDNKEDALVENSLQQFKVKRIIVLEMN
ncbi:TLDc domain-containing protein [Entamoeba marina]